MNPVRRTIRRAMAGAASLTGKRFGLLVASSLVATSAIVATAMTSANGNGPLAALLGRSLAADRTPTVTAPPVEEEKIAGGEAGEAESIVPQGGGPLQAPSEPESEPTPEQSPSGNHEEKKPTPKEEPKSEAGPVKHVFVVSVASSGYEAAFGATSQMPYLSTTLRPEGDLLSNYKLLSASSLPNSIAAVSGQKPTPETEAECPNYEKCVQPAETLSLPDELGIGGFTWRGYMEGMVSPETGQPANCVYPQPGASGETALGGYSERLNPFVYFHSLLDLGECGANDVPITELEKDLKKAEKTPNYSYISPDRCNAGLSGQCAAGTPEGPAAADAFLSQWVPKILASPAYKADGLLIVTFGSVNPTPANPTTGAPATPATDFKTGALLVSRFITPGSTDAVAYTPYSLLKSTDELFGLDPLEAAKAKSVKSFARAVAAAEEGEG